MPPNTQTQVDHRHNNLIRPEDIRDPKSMRLAMEHQGFRPKDLASSDGRQETVLAPNGLLTRSTELIKSIPVDALPQPIAREQVRELSEDILQLIGGMKVRGRIQMGLGVVTSGLHAVVPGLGLAGSVGSHFLGWDEVKVKKQLTDSVDALCKVAAASGIKTDKLEDALQATADPLSKKRVGFRIRSILTTVFLPIARSVHRLIQEGNWSQVAYEVKKIQKLVQPASVEEEKVGATA